MPTKAYVYNSGRWVLVGTGGGSAAIVSVPEPADPGVVGSLWINPAELIGTVLTTDVLEAIRGQVIAPRAIDLDGPNTLYISQDIDGSVKLSLRSDSVRGGKLDSFFATESWVLQNSSNIHIGQFPPLTPNTLWLNPEGGGGGSLGGGVPPVVVSEVAPTTTSSLWLNPKG